MSPKQVCSVRDKLLRWYDKDHRDLPWRRTGNPYAIWVAESMLQQTQVTTVVPYYNRFLKRFPTLRALARASLPEVLTLWSGLGYYRRAENLRKSAREVILKHHGQLPQDYDKLLSLPGVGQYTAGALMSIAFGEPYPALDGNARRVLGRVFSLRDQAELRETAKRLVPRTRPGDLNQAVMELGATVCLSKAPRCGECPLAFDCYANHHQGGSMLALSRPKVLKHVTWPLAIVRRKGKLLLRRRAAAGMLAGLWEFPGGVLKKKPTRESLNKLIGELGVTLGRKRCIGVLRHAITDKKIRAPIFLFDLSPLAEPHLANRDWRWVAPASLRRYPVSSMTLKAATILTTHEKTSR